MEFLESSVSIDEDEIIAFPDNYFYKRVLNKNLLIVPFYPTWIVLDDEEFELFSLL